jgi:two-component system NtrC family sensor kinase
MLRRGGLDVRNERNLRVIATQIERIARIVRGMLDFSRVRETFPGPTSLRAVLERVAELVEQRLQHARVRLEWTLPEALPELSAEPDRLEQVFLNIAVNAIDAMRDGGVLEIGATPVMHEHPEMGGGARQFLAVTIQDSGCGIAPQHLERVFDPFFTTKEVGAGTGLGLSISYGIVREHGGWIDIQSQPGAGTCVTVMLPVADAMSAAAGGSAS